MKKQLLLEDTISLYNKWVQGLAAREFNAQRLKFKDLFSTNHDLTTQGPNEAKAGNTLPYPLQNAVSILGDLTTNMSNAISAFTQAIKNPVIERDPKAKVEIERIIAFLEKSQHELDNVFNTIEISSDAKSK